MFRIVVLRGARRAEAVGFRWSGADLDSGYLTVERPILLIGSEVTEDGLRAGLVSARCGSMKRRSGC